MSIEPDLGPILRFLDGLKDNNNKVWFEQHRPDYQEARGIFEQFIDALLDEFRSSDHLQGLSARDCIPRIYRDIRFSWDKSPYKTNLGAMIAPGGWKATQLGYYVSIEPQGLSMVAGGLYNPTSQQLNSFRRVIDRDAAGFKKLTQNKAFVDIFGPLSGDRLKTAPKGYDGTHTDIAILQLKQITAIKHFTDPEVLGTDFAGQVATACRALKPFLAYLNNVIA